MKICWSNLKDLSLNSSGTFVKRHNSFIEMDKCKKCGHPYLTSKYRPSEYCDRSCSLSEREFSDETRTKMSKAWESRAPVSEETRLKQSIVRKGKLVGYKNGMYGKTHTDAVKSSISKRTRGNKFRLGVLHSEDTKKLLSKLNTGCLNANWKGGISCEPYCFEWSFKEYKDFIKERDKNTCLNSCCQKVDSKLRIHHIDYNKKNCHPSNLITVCSSCNSRANKDRDWHTAWYRAILHKRYGFEYK